MSELRDHLLDDSELPPVPEGTPPEMQTVASRQAGLVAILPRNLALYRELYGRYRDGGLSVDEQAVALEAAGDLGLLLQELRRHDELVRALRAAPHIATIPFRLLEALYGSLLLLSDTIQDFEVQVLFEPGELEVGFFQEGEARDWLDANGYGPALDGPGEDR